MSSVTFAGLDPAIFFVAAEKVAPIKSGQGECVGECVGELRKGRALQFPSMMSRTSPAAMLKVAVSSSAPTSARAV